MIRNFKMFLLLVFSALIVISCGVRPQADGGLRPIKQLNEDNFSAYSVTLSPYEVKIIQVSNYSDTESFDDSEGWWQDAVGYELYVRSFYDTDGDGVGDFNGLVQKMDYIDYLGVDAIWTLPVFKSYHDGTTGRALGYEAEDYYDVDPDYGTFDEWQAYIDEAHNRDVKVIMDMVINHAATNIEWFQASISGDPEFDDWYIWTNATLEELEESDWQMPWGSGRAEDVWHYSEERDLYYYATWGAELNFKNQEVRDESFNIARFWIERGVDGYRLDAIRYLIEEGPHPLQADTQSSLDYMVELQAEIKDANPLAMTVGEVWSGDSDVAKYYLDGVGFDQCFTFDFMYKLTGAVSSEKNTQLKTVFNMRPEGTPDMYFSPFIENHDVQRSMVGFDYSFDRAKVAAAILMTYIGTPYLYFGQEIGMTGQFNPMNWDSTETAGFTESEPWLSINDNELFNVAGQIDDSDSLLNTYRRLITFRKDTPAIRRGGFEIVKTGTQAVYSFMRTGTNVSYIIVANLTEDKEKIELNLSSTEMLSNQTYDLFEVELRD